MNKNFLDFMRNFDGQKMAVGVSGGVDSVALLHWLVEIGADVVCLHVNHNLRPSAGVEAQYVADLCKKLGVECHIFSWDGEKPETGLEDAARVARYKFMTDFCHKNKIKIILTAHQADDQIETFWMNLGRGSGVYGLAAMRNVGEMDGIKIVRPLLGVFRRELRDYCDTRGIKYFADEMNDDPHYTRVKIRQNRHLVGDALGISDERILLAIQNMGRVRETLENYVDKLVARVMLDGRAMFSESFLFDQSPDIRLKFLGTIIQMVGGDRYQPRLNSLVGAVDKLHDDCKFTIGHCTVRRFRGRILVVREGKKTSFRIRKRYHGKKYIKK
ncbi:MAG: tRNA lysidine(34) synthetase TilS [Alphaproteobacteria bacterium]|nr:tRNA lysidine(34) synthetase TilS [Alphaproteobacteria bacterium]